MISKALFHLAPLAQNRFSPLPIGAVRPRDWLKEEVVLCQEGITKRLHEVVDDMEGFFSVENASLFAYHMNAVILISHQLRDEALMEKAAVYVQKVLNSQDDSGSFGPSDTYVRTLLLRGMIHYYTATGDAQIPPFLLRYFRYLYLQMDQEPLSGKSAVAAADMAYACMWAYDLTGKSFLLKLAKQILEQGMDWTALFHAFPYNSDLKKTLSWAELEAGLYRSRTPNEKNYYIQKQMQTHAVNVAQGLKQPMLSSTLTGGLKQSQAFHVGYDRIMKAHGVAHGMFTGDAHLSGDSPSQGTETLAVTEFLTTMGINLSQSDASYLSDIWEKLAYNALPAATTADFKAQQTVQQVNQVLVSKASRDWYNMGDTANLFSTQVNSQTAALEGAWSQFAANLWMATREGGVVAMSYAPCSVRWHVHGEPYRIYVESNYPFDSSIRITIRAKTPLQIPITLRIPHWAEGARIFLDGAWQECENGKFVTIDREWGTEESFQLELPMSVNISRWQHQSAAVERGPVLYALRIGEKWATVGHDLCVEATTPWNYALMLEEGFSVESYPANHLFCDQYPVILRARGVRISDWRLNKKSAAVPPVLPNIDCNKAENIDLVPYGCTALRITQFPVGLEAEAALQAYQRSF